MSQGVDALRGCLSALRAEGCRYAVVDAVDNGALHTIAAACQELPLITAGSGVALGLPAVYAARGWITPDQTASHLPAAGSCSQATRAQVARWRAQGRPAFQIDPLALARGDDVAGQALAAWHADPRQPHLFYATAEPEAVRQAQHALGAQQAGAQVEACLARIAQGLVAAGVRRLVVAGGETSGAVVQALGVQQLRIGPSIAPGVPWTQVHGRELLLALKSGNFGSEDFFAQALAMSA